MTWIFFRNITTFWNITTVMEFRPWRRYSTVCFGIFLFVSFNYFYYQNKENCCLLFIKYFFDIYVCRVTGNSLQRIRDIQYLGSLKSLVFGLTLPDSSIFQLQNNFSRKHSSLKRSATKWDWANNLQEVS